MVGYTCLLYTSLIAAFRKEREHDPGRVLNYIASDANG